MPQPASQGVEDNNIAVCIEATQDRARAIAIETVMMEPIECTAHRFVDQVCLFCGVAEPVQEAT